MYRPPPIRKSAISPPLDPAHGSACIFLHGLGDDASGWEVIANQFQAAGKLPYMQWIFPNALENRDAMQTAWYTPTSLSPYPASRPELEEDEDEDGMKQSVTYIESLIAELVSEGVSLNRIILGGFSQGHAMTLFAGMTSKYSGTLAGIFCLSGYMPLANRIKDIRVENGFPERAGSVPIFLARGTKDILVPRRHHRICHEKLLELGVQEDLIEVHEYEGLAHAASAQELRDLCSWMEKIAPPMS